MPFGVDQGEIVGEQAHPDPPAPLLGPRCEQAEVVVRLLPGVARVEAVLGLEHDRRLLGAEQLGQQRLDLRLILG